MHEIPSRLPTNVVLTATEAEAKAREYLAKYFPLKSLVPQLRFKSNYLEYAAPNYHYIRPADETGFSDYVAGPDEIHLIWKNVFLRPEGTREFPFIEIHVDSATGEMLGGVD